MVDPGIGVLTRLDEVLASTGCSPVAVLLTHGHLDHTFSVTPVCGARGITAYIHPDDRERLADPAKGLSRRSQPLFGGRLTYAEPDDVARAARRRRDHDGRPGPHRRPRARAHRGVGAVPAAGTAPDTEARPVVSAAVTCSSPARSAAPTCPAVDWPAMAPACGTKILPLADETAGAARPRPGDHDRARAAHQSVPAPMS